MRMDPNIDIASILANGQKANTNATATGGGDNMNNFMNPNSFGLKKEDAGAYGGAGKFGMKLM